MLLIMDEPTSSLSDNEIQLLFKYIRKLKDKGCTIIYISHKLEEVLEISDVVTIMRDGKHVMFTNISEITKDEMIYYMVNREFTDVFPELTSVPGKVILKVEGISRENVVTDCSFYARKGEILGITGLMGAGRTELMRILFGIDKPDSGKVFINDKEVKIKSPASALKYGIGFITEDRRKTGIIPLMSVSDNATLPSLNRLSKLRIFLQNKLERSMTEEYIDKLKIKTPSIYQPIKYLSGGNQQKVILAKWLLRGVDILIMDEPTRGIDVNAKRVDL